jgi:hypothetical protein
MKNNFDLKKFLTENKLTTNSRQISENTNLPELRKQVESKLSGKHDEHLVDSVLHDCFESAEVLMDEQPGTSAVDALYSVAENWEENYYDEGRDEEEAIAKDIVSVVEPLSGDSTSGIFSEIDADLLKRAQNTPAPKDAADKLAKRKAGTHKQDRRTVQASMGPNAEEEQKVIDICKDAIGLMDEQPGTSAKLALKTVLGSKSEGFMGVGKNIVGVPLKKDDDDSKKIQVTLTGNGFPNKKEQQIVDIAKAAIGLMDEQPGTSAEEALKSVLDI